MKPLIWILFIAALGSLLAGFAVNSEYSEQLIGSGVVGLFLVVFPLFSYYRWKDKKVSDYMLTKENLEKITDLNDKKD